MDYKGNQNDNQKNEHSSLVQRLQKEAEVFYNNFYKLLNIGKEGAFFNMPKVDISEGESEYYINIEVPGVSKKDIEISVKRGKLVIEGEKKSKSETKDRHFHKTECFYGKFHREIDLPQDVDENNIDAKYDEGLLELKIGKSKSNASNSKKVQIK